MELPLKNTDFLKMADYFAIRGKHYVANSMEHTTEADGEDANRMKFNANISM